MKSFFLVIIIGVILLGAGWFSRSQGRRAIVITGTVVAMRREIQRRRDLASRAWVNVTVYKPIVRFSSSGGEQEAVVDDASEYKPELNTSMEIAFLPENPAKAWRLSKQGVTSDLLMFAGVCLVIVGILGMCGLLPFAPGGKILGLDESLSAW